MQRQTRTHQHGAFLGSIVGEEIVVVDSFPNAGERTMWVDNKSLHLYHQDKLARTMLDTDVPFSAKVDAVVFYPSVFRSILGAAVTKGVTMNLPALICVLGEVSNWGYEDLLLMKCIM